jgi:hypothetical protein
MAGFNAWSDVTGKAMAVQVASADSADLIVNFENLADQPRDGDFLGSTSWTYSPSSLQTFESEMILRTWNGITSTQISNGFRSTAQHEFGHAIFLAGHSPNDEDSMYPFSNVNDFVPLSIRDENSLLTAYCGSFDDRASTWRAGEKLVTTTIDCPAE